MWPNISRAQNIQHTSKLADSIKRGAFRVDPSTLALNFDIPLAAFPGRGDTGLPVTLHYSSKVWRIAFVQAGDPELHTYDTLLEPRWSGGWAVSLDPPTVEVPPGEYYTAGGLPANAGWVVRRVLVHLPGGATHELRHTDPIVPGSPSQPPPSYSGTYEAVDGSGLRYVWDTRTLSLSDGSRYVIGHDFPPSPTVFTDRHGNTRTYDPAHQHWTDTLGRVIPLPFTPGRPPHAPGDHVYTLPGVGGAPVNFTLRWAELADSLTDPGRQVHYVDDCAGTPSESPGPHLFVSDVGAGDILCGGWVFNPVVLRGIVLPNATSYEFTYNVYGELDKVVYPTGGYERFRHAGVEPAHRLTGVYAQGNRGVVEHWVSASGAASDEARWQYATEGHPFMRVITAPDHTRTERRLHHSGFEPSAWGFDDVRIGRAFDERVSAAGGRMLRRSLAEWTGTTVLGRPHAAAPRVTRETEVLFGAGDDAVAASSLHTYDADYNRGSTERYGFAALDRATAAEAPVASLPLGPLRRRDETTYLVNDPELDPGTRAAYRARHLVSLPTSARVKDPAGAVVAQTRVRYDEAASPLLDCAPAIGRADPGTNVRGNATSSGAWLDTTGGWVETHAQYDRCGNARRGWDANDNLSQTAYDAAYHHAYPTRTTSPVPDPSGRLGASTSLETTTAYDLTTGRVTSGTDANGVVTTREYQDPLHRPTREVRAAGTPAQSQTSWHYDDAARVVTTTSDLNLYDDGAIKGEAVYDGLGRLAETRAYETATAYVATHLTYDALGRGHQVSNPFRAPGRPAAWTTTAYDALGRVTSVTTPDGAAVRTDYDGDRVLVTDPAGKQRISRADALGHLVEVWEVRSPDPASGTEAVAFPSRPGVPAVAAGYRTAYRYDVLGNLRQVEQGGQIRFFAYDSLGRLVRARNPARPSLMLQLASGSPSTRKSESWS